MMVDSYIIRSRYHSLCSVCKMAMKPGEEVEFTPAHDGKKASVRHTDQVRCGGQEYLVNIIFHTTRKVCAVRAYTAAEAIETVRANKRKKYYADGKPEHFTVELKRATL